VLLPPRTTATTNYVTAASNIVTQRVTATAITHDATAAGIFVSPSRTSATATTNDSTAAVNFMPPWRASATPVTNDAPVSWNDAFTIMSHLADENRQGKAPCDDDAGMLPTGSQKFPHQSAIPPPSATSHSDQWAALQKSASMVKTLRDKN
jgi:hypothetical protein